MDLDFNMSGQTIKHAVTKSTPNNPSTNIAALTPHISAIVPEISNPKGNE
tara:strand:- start:181 stop:330 length:150 start_codon:yes stop_codon:yes gene_type:complete